MKKKNLFYLVFSIFLLGKNAVSQSSSSTAGEVTSIKQLSLEEELEGTYEIIILDPKRQEVFTNDFVKTLCEKRDDNKDVVYDVSQYTRFLIYSRSKINSPAFTKNRTKK